MFSPSVVSSCVHSNTRLLSPVNLGHVACGDSPVTRGLGLANL